MAAQLTAIASEQFVQQAVLDNCKPTLATSMHATLSPLRVVTHVAFVAVLSALLQGFMVNLDLQKDIWQKGFNALAATAAPGIPAGAAGASARSKAVLEYKHYSLVMTEPLFNFEAVRATTEEV